MLEKTNYTWDVWLRVIQGMFSGKPVERTRQCLEDDYKCPEINWKTVWGMREKLENAVKWLGLDEDGGWERHTALGDAGVLVGVWDWIRGGE